MREGTFLGIYWDVCLYTGGVQAQYLACGRAHSRSNQTKLKEAQVEWMPVLPGGPLGNTREKENPGKNCLFSEGQFK